MEIIVEKNPTIRIIMEKQFTQSIGFVWAIDWKQWFIILIGQSQAGGPVNCPLNILKPCLEHSTTGSERPRVLSHHIFGDGLISYLKPQKKCPLPSGNLTQLLLKMTHL